MTTAIVIDPVMPQGDRALRATTVGWIDAAHLSTLEVRILCHRDVAGDDLDGLPLEKVFAGGPRRPKDSPRTDRREIRDVLARTLRTVKASDVLILADAPLAALEGLAAWASGVAPAQRPRVVAWIGRPLSPDLAPGTAAATSVAAGLDRLRTLFGAGLRLLAADPDLVTRIGALQSIEAECLPATALERGRGGMDARHRDMLAALLVDEPDAAAPATDTLPGVDIIVPLHNYARFLPACLASVAAQTYPHWRCIVVDDGSTDIKTEALRTLVAGYGERFSLAVHAQCEGQIKAVATGLSLGSSPFVVALDADDRLVPQALDLHLAWHLNGVVPAAFTAGRMAVADSAGVLLAGALDNINPLAHWPRMQPLAARDAFVREGSSVAPTTARFADRDAWIPGEWLWTATSSFMFRRSMVELMLPDEVSAGNYSLDTLLAFGCHLMGSSIAIDATVALYTRHGGNAHSDTAVFGAATMADRANVNASWSTIAAILHRHIETNRARFTGLVRTQAVEHALAITRAAGRGQSLPRPDAPPPFVPRVVRRLRHEARRIRNLAHRLRDR